MLIHQIIEKSTVNGPGTRFCIWVQGCSQNCPGCFNPETHPYNRGKEMQVSSIIRLIKQENVEGITISGGEPFDQSEELLQLLKETHNIGLNTLVYSGYTYEKLKIEYAPVLEEIDILIEGVYQIKEPRKHEWAGSGNQKVLYLEKGNIIEIVSGTQTENGEIIIDEFGSIINTGYFHTK